MIKKKVYGVYVGRRLIKGGKLAHFWKMEGEPELSGFKKQLAPAKIGERWQFTESDKGGVLLTGSDKPTLIAPGSLPEFPEQEQYIAADQAAYQVVCDRAADRRLAARRTDFDAALAPLQRLVRAARAHDERAALIARITAELWRLK